MDKGKAIELTEKYKAVFVRITGSGNNVKISESTPEETVAELDSIWDSLQPGRYTIEFRSNKNNSVDNPKFTFTIPGAVSGIGSPGTGVSGLEGIGGPSAWSLLEENRRLQAQIDKMESDKKMDQVLRQMEDLKRKKKDGDGTGPEKFIGMVTGLVDLVNRHNSGQITASAAGAPVSTPARSLAGPPDAVLSDETAGPDLSEKMGEALEPIINALGIDSFLEIITAMGEKAKLDPEGFKSKLETMRAFL